MDVRDCRQRIKELEDEIRRRDMTIIGLLGQLREESRLAEVRLEAIRRLRHEIRLWEMSR